MKTESITDQNQKDDQVFSLPIREMEEKEENNHQVSITSNGVPENLT